MAAPDAPPAVSAPDDRPPTRLFLGIVLVECLVIAALYWFGRHFV